MFINTDVTFVCMQMTTVLKLVFVLQLNFVSPSFGNVWANYGLGTIRGPGSIFKISLEKILSIMRKKHNFKSFSVFSDSFQ